MASEPAGALDVESDGVAGTNDKDKCQWHQRRQYVVPCHQYTYNVQGTAIVLCILVMYSLVWKAYYFTVVRTLLLEFVLMMTR